jgi:hypothetical protein
MSVSVLDPTHIDLILVTAVHGPTGPRSGPPWVPPRVDELLGIESHLSLRLTDEAGRKLLRANIELVREHQRERAGPLPGHLPTPNPERYEWSDIGLRLTIPEALKALDAYEFRADSRPGLIPSPLDLGAVAFCARLRAALIQRLPGYMEAPGQWTTDLALSLAPRRSLPEDFR